MPTFHMIGLDVSERTKRAELIDAETEADAVAQAKLMGLMPELVRIPGTRAGDRPLPIGEHTARGTLEEHADSMRRMELEARYGVDVDPANPQTAFQRRPVWTIVKAILIAWVLIGILSGILAAMFL